MNEGLVTSSSRFSVAETLDQLVELVTAKGLTIFARIDHAGNACRVAMELRPTELLIFGNPRAGTPLMQDRQTIGLDLPIHVLAWEDSSGAVWVTFNDVEWLARRHGLSESTGAAVRAIADGLALLRRAVAP